MAKKVIRLSDLSGQEIPNGTGATIMITFNNGRRTGYLVDATDAEADEIGSKGRKQVPRGRRPKRAS